jgi:hypothetical protein
MSQCCFGKRSVKPFARGKSAEAHVQKTKVRVWRKSGSRSPGVIRTRGNLCRQDPRFGANHPALITTLAAKYRLPTVYPFRCYIAAGGLISYYLNRIFRGEKPADLPVQAPTRYDLVVNLKTAKVGFSVPPALLARADDVVE